MKGGSSIGISWKAGPIDYSRYRFNVKEGLFYMIQGYLLIGGFIYIFYHSVYLALSSLLLTPIYLIYQRYQLKKRRLHLLRKEFKEAMLCIAAALGAGYGIENAWKEAERELSLLIGEEADMVAEMRHMVRQVGAGKQLEQLLYEFAVRSAIDEAGRFSESFSLARKRGGNLVEILNQAVEKITDQMNVMEEARVLVAAKRFEQRVMSIMPPALILFLNLTAPEFLDILYTTWFGRIMMTVCLLIYVLSLLLSEKILQIEF